MEKNKFRQAHKTAAAPYQAMLKRSSNPLFDKNKYRTMKIERVKKAMHDTMNCLEGRHLSLKYCSAVKSELLLNILFSSKGVIE